MISSSHLALFSKSSKLYHRISKSMPRLSIFSQSLHTFSDLFHRQNFYSKMAGKMSPLQPSDKIKIMQGSYLFSSLSQYRVLEIVGKGNFATVAKCLKIATGKTVTLRIVKINSIDEAKKEDSPLQMLTQLNPDRWHFVRWYESFVCKGLLCQEFEVLDMNLMEFVSKRPTFSLKLHEIRSILFQLATTLEGLETIGVVHADLKPENIMLVDQARYPYRVKVVDFGHASKTSNLKFGAYIQAMNYRAPEIIVGATCSVAADMWSLGCIAAELYLGLCLYPGSCEYQMLQFMIQTQGELPGSLLWDGTKTTKFFERPDPGKWQLKSPVEMGPISDIQCPIDSLDDLKVIHQSPGHPSKAEILEDEADLENFVDLLKQMLQFDPCKRITPDQMKKHPFMTMQHLVQGYCYVKSGGGEKKSSSGIGNLMQKTVSENQAFPEPNCGAPGPQKPISKEDEFSQSHARPAEPRKRAHTDILLGHHRSRTSDSPETNRICRKQPHKDFSRGSKQRQRLIPHTKQRRTVTQGAELKGKKLPDWVQPLKRKLMGAPSATEGDLTRPAKKAKQQANSLERRGTVNKNTEGKCETQQVSFKETLVNTDKVQHRKRKEMGSGSQQKEDDAAEKAKKAKQQTTLTHRGKSGSVTKIWIMGCGNTQQAEEAAVVMFGNCLGLGSSARVKWFHKPATRWPSVLPHFYSEILSVSPPDILVIHAGSNDLGLKPAKELACRMAQDLRKLHTDFPAMKIVYSCIPDRLVWHRRDPSMISNDRETVNSAMKATVTSMGGEVIEHPRLQSYNRDMFSSNGVQLSKEGNAVFLNSIRSSLKSMLEQGNL